MKPRSSGPAGRRRMALAIGLALAAAGSAVARERLLAPRFTAVGEAATPEGAAALRFGAVTVRVYDLAGTERSRMLGELTGAAVDPFDLRRDGQPFFRTFLVEVENAGDSALLFNPSFCFLKISHDRKFPVGYTDLYGYLEPLLGGDAVAARLAPLLDETSATVRPGERLRRLLVFEKLEAKAREAELFLDGLLVDGEPVGTRVRLERRRLD